MKKLMQSRKEGNTEVWPDGVVNDIRAHRIDFPLLDVGRVPQWLHPVEELLLSRPHPGCSDLKTVREEAAPLGASGIDRRADQTTQTVKIFVTEASDR